MSAPQVTPADVEAVIASEHYFTGAQGCIGNVDEVDLSDAALASLDMLTICALVTRNGHRRDSDGLAGQPVGHAGHRLGGAVIWPPTAAYLFWSVWLRSWWPIWG